MRHAHAVGVAGHPSYTWILSGDSGQVLGEDNFAYDAATDADLATVTNGVGVTSLNIAPNPAFEVAWSMLEDNKAIKDYFVDKHNHNSPPLNCTDFEFYDSPTYWDYLQCDVVMALGFAACEAPVNFSQLFDAMTNTLFRGATGTVEFDPNTGTRKTSSLS
jgi:hypothetical protein